MAITKQVLQDVNQSELAALLDVSTQTLGQWKRDHFDFGNFPEGEKKGGSNALSFNYYACKLWHEKYLLSTKYKDYFTSTATEDPTGHAFKTKEEALLRKANLDIELTEIELAKAQGKLLVSKDVETAWSNIILNVRSKLLVIPRRVANLLYEGMTIQDKEAVIENEVREILNTLSSDNEEIE